MHTALGAHLIGHVLAALVTGLVGVGLQLLDAEALLAQHLLQFGGDLRVRPAEITLVEQFLALQAQLVE